MVNARDEDNENMIIVNTQMLSAYKYTVFVSKQTNLQQNIIEQQKCQPFALFILLLRISKYKSESRLTRQ